MVGGLDRVEAEPTVSYTPSETLLPVRTSALSAVLARIRHDHAHHPGDRLYSERLELDKPIRGFQGMVRSAGWRSDLSGVGSSHRPELRIMSRPEHVQNSL